MGHSTGAWIGVIALATEPLFTAGIYSGAGGSWIENVLYKEKPLMVKMFAEVLLDYIADQREVSEHDPALSFVQWAAEGSDPQVYASQAGQHVLMMQGIVDHYILPRIANAVSLSLGLDLAGPSLDAGHPELGAQDPVGAMLAYSGGAARGLPVSGNQAAGMRTRVVTQHVEDGVEDGHETVFQTAPPKTEYRCFLQTLAATGVPTVPARGGPCP
jgi:hypothetical protein